MKRSIAVAVLAASAVVCTAAQAQSALNPQPSFNDSAGVEPLPVGGRTVPSQNFPKPSFVDYVPADRQLLLTNGGVIDEPFPQAHVGDGDPVGPRSVVVGGPAADPAKRNASSPAPGSDG
jgi:hypothetical protein